MNTRTEPLHDSHTYRLPEAPPANIYAPSGLTISAPMISPNRHFTCGLFCPMRQIVIAASFRCDAYTHSFLTASDRAAHGVTDACTVPSVGFKNCILFPHDTASAI